MFSNSDSRLRRRVLGRYRYVRMRWCVLFAIVDAIGNWAFAAARLIRSGCGRAWFNLARPLATNTGRGPMLREFGQKMQTVRRILLVQCDHLGDALITTAMLPPLRRAYPDATIELLAAPWNKEVFEASPEINRIRVWQWNRFNSEHRFAWVWAVFWWGLALRRRRFDLAIDVRGEFPHAVLMWLSGARRRLGWAAGGGGFLLTDSPTFVPDRPEVESRLAILAQLKIRPAPDDGPWGSTFPVRKHPRIEGFLARLDGENQEGARRIVLHVGAGTAAKRWPAEHWRELIGRLVFQQQTQIVLIGGEKDREIAREILNHTRPAGVSDWTGLLNVLELAAVIESADLFVGADSGPAHLAATVGRPVVALFSGTNSVRQWRPSGAQVAVVRQRVECSPCHLQRCPLPPHPCMRGLTPERVARAIESHFRRVADSRQTESASAATQEVYQ